jgi:hypothetical protein
MELSTTRLSCDSRGSKEFLVLCAVWGESGGTLHVCSKGATVGDGMVEDIFGQGVKRFPLLILKRTISSTQVGWESG